VTRAERLLALVAELRAVAPAPVAVGALANLLGVSEPTVVRDIDDLARAGLQVAERDAGVYALAADPQPPAVTGTASLTEPVRHTIADAVRTRRVVRIAYLDHADRRTRRDVEPHGLVIAPYGEYFVGWCRMRDGPRMFRLDRIGAAVLTTQPAEPRELDELLTALRVPAPRRSPDGDHGSPARARPWTLRRVQQVRARLRQSVADARTAPDGAADAITGAPAAMHATLGHLAEWTRWQMAAVRAVATGDDMVFDGRRPPFPDRFDEVLDPPTRERMIQDAMAGRSLREIFDDLDEVLGAAADWATGCDDVLWRQLLPDPAQPGRRRRLADLLAGWWSPLSHIEWHLDRPADDTVVTTDDGVRVVVRCPLGG
jgi:biotin operon repressor